MNRECYLSQPEVVEVFPVKGGTDIIMRKNITKTIKEPDTEGCERYTVWECDEVQLRHKGDVTRNEVEQKFEYWWTLGEGGTEEDATDQEAEAEGKPTIAERLDALEGAVMELAEVLVNG